MSHPSIIGDYAVPGRDRNVQGGFDHFPPSVADGKTHRVIPKSDYVQNAKPQKRAKARTSFDEVGSPGFDEDADDVSAEEIAFREYMASKPGTLRLQLC